jgi:hypothetical protein
MVLPDGYVLVAIPSHGKHIVHHLRAGDGRMS